MDSFVFRNSLVFWASFLDNNTHIHPLIVPSKKTLQASETTWGLTKEGISLSIQIATGAGVTGTLAVTATAAVTASLTAVAAAPLAITLAATATRSSFAAKRNSKSLVWV